MLKGKGQKSIKNPVPLSDPILLFLVFSLPILLYKLQIGSMETLNIEKRHMRKIPGSNELGMDITFHCNRKARK